MTLIETKFPDSVGIEVSIGKLIFRFMREYKWVLINMYVC